MTRYILICRHGAHHHGVLKAVKSDGEEVYPTDAIGERLREQLELTFAAKDMPLGAIWCADSTEAKETLARLLIALGLTCSGDMRSAVSHAGSAVPITIRDDLAPPKCMRPGAEGMLAEQLRDVRLGRPDTAVLVVGHQPQLSWIADQLLRTGRKPLSRPPPVPIDRAGLVCVTLHDCRERAKLAWAISFDDKEAARLVREKIRLKMDTAKLLAGAVTLGLTVIFGVLFNTDQFDGLGARRWAVQVAGGLLLAAALLYFGTMYAYDSLLMPERFWGERKPSRKRLRRSGSWLVDRPPSSAAWILYQNMMRVWRNLFTSASLLVGAAISLLGYAALRIRLWQVFAIAVPVHLIVGLWAWWSRPVLGSED
jgi:broad specificity phosphatase PhoE